MIPTSYSATFKHIVDLLYSNAIPMLYGKPGSGKSALAAAVAEHLNLCLIDMRLSDYEPTDINGYMRYNDKTGRGEYVPMNMIPIEGDKVPVNPKSGVAYDGWLLFLDEITNAEDPVLKVIYRVLQDRMVSGNKRVHPQVVMMAAGNLGEEDGSMANVMPTTLQSRMVALNLNITAEEWLLNEAKEKAAPNVLAYITSNPDKLHVLDMDSYNDVNFPCHRNWSRVSRYLKQTGQIDVLDEEQCLAPLAGAVGQATATEFVVFTQLYKDIPPPLQMLQNPGLVVIPRDNPPLCAIMTNSVIPHVTEALLPNAVQLFKRFDGPMQALAMRSLIQQNNAFIDLPAVKDWLMNEGKYLIPKAGAF